MTLTTCCDRCLDAEIDGAVNFRDVGGQAGPVRVRRGLVYRSGMTHTLTDAGLRALAERYGLRTVIDLRSDEELAGDGRAPFARVGVRHVHAPVFRATDLTREEREARFAEMRAGTYDWAAAYAGMLEVGGPAYRRMFETLATTDALPAVFQCAAGRDRTGVAAALLLDVIGVDHDTIARDYALTGVHLRPHADRFRGQSNRMSMSSEELARLLDTSEAAMTRFLGTLTHRYGSAAGYLASVGVAASTLMAVCERLLEPAGG
jgi:protein-tyrosine phosphatase